MRFKDEVDLMCIVLWEQFEIKSHLASGCIELSKNIMWGVMIGWE